MAREFEICKSSHLKAGSSFARPTQIFPNNVNINDPAITVMTDLSKVSMVVTRPNITMDTANAKMIRYGVRMLLVLDSNDNIAGVLTASDILGEKPIRFLQNMGGTHADILVRDLMKPQRELEVFNIEDVRNANVGQIVASLKAAGRQHGLVVAEGNDGKQTVCGIFSVTQVARQLRLGLDEMFSEVEAVVSLSN
ncbi:MAG TPA: CBS domain-containing protein [Desulfuromonadales bacterium]|nr:CBS domain-containing protein [Desulfuromonadales bacterium]